MHRVFLSFLDQGQAPIHRMDTRRVARRVVSSCFAIVLWEGSIVHRRRSVDFSGMETAYRGVVLSCFMRRLFVCMAWDRHFYFRGKRSSDVKIHFQQSS
jgi:hypothetical protein